MTYHYNEMLANVCSLIHMEISADVTVIIILVALNLPVVSHYQW